MAQFLHHKSAFFLEGSRSICSSELRLTEGLAEKMLSYIISFLSFFLSLSLSFSFSYFLFFKNVLWCLSPKIITFYDTFPHLLFLVFCHGEDNKMKECLIYSALNDIDGGSRRHRRGLLFRGTRKFNFLRLDLIGFAEGFGIFGIGWSKLEGRQADWRKSSVKFS